jgi:hypothetical protein
LNAEGIQPDVGILGRELTPFGVRDEAFFVENFAAVETAVLIKIVVN